MNKYNLYYCITQCGINKYKSENQLKYFLHLDDITTTEAIDVIERKTKTGINIVGDKTRIPKIETSRNIYLKFENNKYSIDYSSAPKNINSHYTNFERKLKIVDKEETVDLEEYIVVKLEKVKKLIGKCTKDEAENWATKEIEFLKSATKGKINMFKSGWIQNTCLHLFNEYQMKLNHKIDNITVNEYQWLENCKKGAFSMCLKTGTFEDCHYYDFKSHYPSIMASPKFNVPLREGIFTKITNECIKNYKTFSYGIYRCKVGGNFKFFKYNDKNYYTNFDLNTARKYNLSIEMIEDGEDNFLSYPKQLKNEKIEPKTAAGSTIFGLYVNDLIELRDKYPEHKIIIKSLLNCLWGCLSRLFTYKYVVRCDEDAVQFGENETIVNSYLFNFSKMVYETVRSHKIYRTNYARMKPFLLSYQRMIMTDTLTKYSDNILFVKTDGFLTDKYLDYPKTGKIGDLLYDKSFSFVKIENINKISKYI
jgi:hypothetical protein